MWARAIIFTLLAIAALAIYGVLFLTVKNPPQEFHDADLQAPWYLG